MSGEAASLRDEGGGQEERGINTLMLHLTVSTLLVSQSVSDLQYWLPSSSVLSFLHLVSHLIEQGLQAKIDHTNNKHQDFG